MNWRIQKEEMADLDQQEGKCKWCGKNVSRKSHSTKDLCPRCNGVYPKVHELYEVCQVLKIAYEKEVRENDR